MRIVALTALATMLMPLPLSAEPIKLTTDQIASLYAGLSGLDGYDRVVKDGPQERVIKTFYDLGGGLRLSIAKDMAHLREILTIYQTAHAADLAAAAGDAAKIAAEDGKMRAAPETVDLDYIRSSELNLDKNPIPASVLSLLSPLLKD